MHIPQSPQCREELLRVSYLPAQLAGLDIEAFDLWGSRTSGIHQRRAQRDLQCQLLLHSLMALRQGAECLQAPREVTDGLEVGRALQSPFPSPLPAGNRLLCEPSLRIVMRQQFGLRLDQLGKL